MKGLLTLAISLLILEIPAFAGEGADSESSKQKRHNILFIAVDDLRPEILAFGAEHSVTPAIDKLASSGVFFDRAYCMVPTCGASRAALMTGLRPANNRFTSYQTYAEKDAPGAKPIHSHFKDAGYYTMSLGKVFHHTSDHEDGWSEKPWKPKAERYVTEEAKKQTKPDSRGRLRGPPTESADVPDETYADGLIAAEAIKKLRKRAGEDQPFFLAVGFVKPHLPFVAPTKYWDLYDAKTVRMPDNYFAPKNAPKVSIHNSGELRNYSGVPKTGLIPEKMALDLIHGYHACVSYMDAQVGGVLDELERLELADNTVVVLWGDHGWNLGEHTLWCKHSCYETSLRAPLIFRSPVLTDAGKGASGALVEFIDVYPTLCELAGLATPDHVDGKSLVPVLKNPASNHKEAAISRFGPGDTIRTDRYRYTMYRDRSGEVSRMLYDHEKDPNENLNISGNPEMAPIIEDLEKRLLRDMGKPSKK